MYLLNTMVFQFFVLNFGRNTTVLHKKIIIKKIIMANLLSIYQYHYHKKHWNVIK